MKNIVIGQNYVNNCVLASGEVVDFSMRWHNQLVEDIKEWRLEKSRLVGLPAYCIFPDKTIYSLINILPTTIENLWLVSGFNEIIIDTYGNELIELINQFLKDNDIVDIIYGTSSFDLKNHKVKGILGYLGLLGKFNKTDTTEQKIKINSNTHEPQKEIFIETKRNYEQAIEPKHVPRYKKVEINDIVGIKFDNEETMQCQIISPQDEYKPTFIGTRINRKLGSIKTRKLNPDGCFSSDTPFAKAILGKYLFEHFQYTVNNITISGQIIDIQENNE